MLEKPLRPHYNNLLVLPLAKKLTQSPQITPNSLTLLSLLLGLSLIPTLYLNFNKLAIFLLLLSGYLDTLDGTLARLQNKTTPLGSCYDIIADRVVEFSALLGLLLIDPRTRALPCFIVLGSFYLCITSFLVIGIFSQNSGQKGFHYNAGLIERAEVFIFFIIMILLPTYFSLLAWLLAGLVLVTSILHCKQFIRQQQCKH